MRAGEIATIDPGDSGALADRLLRLLNCDEREKMGESGQRIAQERFDLRRNFQKVLSAVETIIAQNQPKVANVIS